ncbi:MFS transporter [Paenibacillus radicis (ex Gao et al. 2016)]|uniref:MFS transporter n=1 Tax=Paenibacillus radicis (ex Gao et al. 2016) TaxID=1737354 RepID=A0A917M149_9BACL|nr:MFS transporter [Paenibacillus radicis (ex Gao et al. 2016)]GGG68572.1 MFS transporter [Paenibacillus radicis (ex Gao et al. 2016)]
MASAPAKAIVKHGIKENIGTFSLLLIINLFVGSMVGLERTVLPLVGEKQFALASTSAALSFIVSFGLSKGIVNYFAGQIADRLGRKKVLILGWIIGFFVPLLVIVAHEWWVIVAANVFLGINQALTWSMTVNMKIDLVKANQRGLAIGLNEAAGYVGLSLAAMLSGYVAASYSLRPEPFLLGFVFIAIGLVLSLTVRSTEEHLRLQSVQQGKTSLSAREIFWLASWKDRNLSSSTLAGIATNLKDGMAWGLFPLFLLMQGLSVGKSGLIIAAYPVAWGCCQLFTGYLSDRVGRKKLIVSGMILQGAAIWWILLSHSFPMWFTGSILLGLGTALVYPTLQAAISDVAQPHMRASIMGVYRFWRDIGYALGAILAGLLTDFINIYWAMGLVALLPLLAGIGASVRMKETLLQKAR